MKLLNIIKSTCMAALGVQSRANQEQDFQEGNAVPFIISGIIFTILFIGTLVFVVNRVIGN